MSNAVLSQKPKFPLGAIFVSCDAKEALEKTGESADDFLALHVRGDSGGEDSRGYDDRIRRGTGTLLSAYQLKDGTPILVVTQLEYNVTNVCLDGDE